MMNPAILAILVLVARDRDHVVVEIPALTLPSWYEHAPTLVIAPPKNPDTAQLMPVPIGHAQERERFVRRAQVHLAMRRGKARAQGARQPASTSRTFLRATSIQTNREYPSAPPNGQGVAPGVRSLAFGSLRRA